MTWFLQGVELPIPPAKLSKRTIRAAKIVTTLNDFPNPDVNQPTKFELQLEGLIWPRSLAKALDEATKNAETADFLVFTDDHVFDDPWITGMYAVTRSEVRQDKFLIVDGTDEVFNYKITFSKFADLGNVESSDSGENDEIGAGFLDLPDDLGFDSDGDGKIDFTGIFNMFTNIMSYGNEQ